jgi:hypothetical protein
MINRENTLEHFVVGLSLFPDTVFSVERLQLRAGLCDVFVCIIIPSCPNENGRGGLHVPAKSNSSDMFFSAYIVVNLLGHFEARRRAHAFTVHVMHVFCAWY